MNRGAALIVTLWVMVLLTVLAMSFSFSTRFGSASTRNFKEDTLAHYLAVSAYEEALAYLLTDTDLEVDLIDEENNFLTDEDREPVTGVREQNGLQVELKITDEESRLNINTVSSANLRKLLEYSGAEETDIQGLVDSLADWKDEDDLHHPSGAEDEYYEPLGYETKDKPLDVPEELLLVKGFTPEYFHGSDSARGLGDLITTWGQGLNVNTISSELLDALELSPLDIDALMSTRGSGKALRSVPRSLMALGATTRSSNFRVQVSVKAKDSPRALRITSVVRRKFGPEGPELKTVYWKEDFENSGT